MCQKNWTIWKKDKFLDTHTLPKLKQGKNRKKLNRHISRKEIESLLKNLPTNKSPGPDGFSGKIYQTFKAELKPTMLKLFKK